MVGSEDVGAQVVADHEALAREALRGGEGEVEEPGVGLEQADVVGEQDFPEIGVESGVAHLAALEFAEAVGEDEEAVAASAQGLEDGEGVGEGLCLRRDEGEEVLGKGFEERAAGGAGRGPGREYALGIERAEAVVVARFLPGEAEGVGEALEVEPVFVYFPRGIVGPELLVVGGIEA